MRLSWLGKGLAEARTKVVVCPKIINCTCNLAYLGINETFIGGYDTQCLYKPNTLYGTTCESIPSGHPSSVNQIVPVKRLGVFTQFGYSSLDLCFFSFRMQNHSYSWFLNYRFGSQPLYIPLTNTTQPSITS
jgi:hypothetical protein